MTLRQLLTLCSYPVRGNPSFLEICCFFPTIHTLAWYLSVRTAFEPWPTHFKPPEEMVGQTYFSSLSLRVSLHLFFIIDASFNYTFAFLFRFVLSLSLFSSLFTLFLFLLSLVFPFSSPLFFRLFSWCSFSPSLPYAFIRIIKQTEQWFYRARNWHIIEDLNFLCKHTFTDLIHAII